MRGHTGGVISLGKGMVSHKSSKQKLNAKSSTEAEVIGASDHIAHTVWMKRFLAGQGYRLNKNVFYQDNESAIRLEQNGFGSRGEKSRHINIRYFFIKDILKSENIELRHCATERMIADFFTKPLQGGLFKTMKKYIMGHAKIPIEERIGNENEDGKNPKNVAIGIRHQKEEKKKKDGKESYADVVRAGMAKRGEREAKNMRRKKVDNVQGGKINVSSEK